LGNFVNSPLDGLTSTTSLLSLDASFAITPHVHCFEAPRRTAAHNVRPPCQGSQTGLECHPYLVESSGWAGFVAKPTNPACMAQPYHTKLRAHQAFHLRHPDILLTLASFLDLASTDAPAPCSQLCVSLLAPCEPHLIPLSTESLEPTLLISPSPKGHSG
jgi:hypothetical protein